MFNVAFQDPVDAGKQNFAYQNSWGLSTRTIGAVVMIHGDDKGLVLPPRVAAVQVIVLPVGITAKTSEDDKNKLYEKVSEVTKELVDAGIAAEKDDRDNVSPGWKFNHWELKGVPIRLEVGPRDLKESKVTAVLRWNQEKHSIALTELVIGVREHLEQIHFGMYEKYVESYPLFNLIIDVIITLLSEPNLIVTSTRKSALIGMNSIAFLTTNLFC